MSIKSYKRLKENYYLSVKATLKCFRKNKKISREDTFLISGNNLFQKLGVTALNTPCDLSQDTGTCNGI